MPNHEKVKFKLTNAQVHKLKSAAKIRLEQN